MHGSISVLHILGLRLRTVYVANAVKHLRCFQCIGFWVIERSENEFKGLDAEKILRF